jgi:hypothetical protein
MTFNLRDDEANLYVFANNSEDIKSISEDKVSAH